MAVVVLALAPLLAACGPRVVFWGDSELNWSREEVSAAQTGPDQSTETVIYAKIGCGLMTSGDTTDCKSGSTQAAVDQFWKQLIKADAANPTPAFIQVELGINDAFWHTSAELKTYAQRIRHFLSWLPAGVPVLWDNIPEMAPAPDPTVDTNDQIINRALARVAKSSSVLHIVDLRTAFKGKWPAWYQADQLHYNDIGQQQFARVNCEALNALSASLDPNRVGVDAPCDPQAVSTRSGRNGRVALRPGRAGA